MPEDGLMTIGRAAEILGVATSTLRYYQKLGLLVPASRSRAGYRMYAPEDMDRGRFIRSAQAAGFALEDIRALMSLQPDDPASCKAAVVGLIEQRLKDVDRKLADLKRVRETLRQARQRCRSSKGECMVLKDLSPARSTRRRR
jgi:DNA-binding transcriptional MerR regulator